jgi:hypothetical protein
VLAALVEFMTSKRLARKLPRLPYLGSIACSAWLDRGMVNGWSCVGAWRRSQDPPLAEVGPGAPHFVSGDDDDHLVIKVRTAHRTLRPRLARFLADYYTPLAARTPQVSTADECSSIGGCSMVDRVSGAQPNAERAEGSNRVRRLASAVGARSVALHDSLVGDRARPHATPTGLGTVQCRVVCRRTRDGRHSMNTFVYTAADDRCTAPCVCA